MYLVPLGISIKTKDDSSMGSWELLSFFLNSNDKCIYHIMLIQFDIICLFLGGCLTHEPFRVGEGRMGNSGWTRVLCLYS